MHRYLIVFIAGAVSGAAILAAASAFRESRVEAQERWQVTGIGGVFFKARDPDALRAWYQTNLGLKPEVEGTILFWSDEGDPPRRVYTVWSPFPEGTRYFDPSPKPFMFNYRVRNLDALLADLRARGFEVDDGIETYEYGRFGWAMDPEGNRIELWEPSEGWTPPPAR